MDAAGQEGVGGTPWSEAEVSAVVDSYFRMLASERAGVSYSKVENRRRLMTTVRRSEGSIERKLQNVSAVLDLLGVQWFNGYKPLAHYHDSVMRAWATNECQSSPEMQSKIRRFRCIGRHFREVFQRL